MRPTNEQLFLLETPPFAGGPARAPRSRTTKAGESPSLALPFDRVRLPPPNPILARSQSYLRSKLESPPPPPPKPPADPFEVPEVSEVAEASDSEERIFLLPRLSSAERSELLALLAEAVGASSARGSAVEVSSGRSRLQLRMEQKILRATFSGRDARARWLPPLLRVTAARGWLEVD
jgi:hypothetical protein